MAVKSVLVIGAGIGGVGAAVALGNKGVSVDVIEAKPISTVLGVGINQPGNSLRALDALGVLDEVLAKGFKYEGNEWRTRDDKLITFVPSILKDDRVPSNCALTRGALRDILMKAANKVGVNFHYETKLVSYTESADGVEATFTNGTTKKYDAIAAFDGWHSEMRKHLFGDQYEPTFTGSSVWRLQLPRPAEVTHPILWTGAHGKGGVIPLSQDLLYMLLVTPEPGNPHYDPADFANLMKERMAEFGGYFGEIRDSLKGDEPVVYSPLYELMVPKPWSKGRVIILGDAAHVAVPHLTQGAGMALEDAVVLGDELTREGRSVEESLVAVADIRFDRANLIYQAGHGILMQEQATNEENLPFVYKGIEEHVAEATAGVETVLNHPFRAA